MPFAVVFQKLGRYSLFGSGDTLVICNQGAASHVEWLVVPWRIVSWVVDGTALPVDIRLTTVERGEFGADLIGVGMVIEESRGLCQASRAA